MVGGSLGLVQGMSRTSIQPGSALGKQFKEAWVASGPERGDDGSAGNPGVPAEDAFRKVCGDNRREDGENPNDVKRWYRLKAGKPRGQSARGMSVL